MELTPSNLNAMFTAYDVRWQSAYTSIDPWWDRFAMLAPSGTTQNTYAWMAKIPTLRKWLGERQAQNVQAYSYTIVNDDYELTMKLDRNTIEDDQFGLYNPVIDDMGQQSRKWPDYLVADLMMAGDGNLANTALAASQTIGFDGVTYYNVAHPVDPKKAGSATYSNLLTTTALSVDNYQIARAQFATFKGEDGKPFGIRPDTLTVPAQLEHIGNTILKADFVGFSPVAGKTAVGSTSNVLKGTSELVVLDELAARATEWYLHVTKRAIKPFVHQLRKAPEFVYFNQPNSESVFNRREFVYGVHARGAAGYSLPFLSLKGIA